MKKELYFVRLEMRLLIIGFNDGLEKLTCRNLIKHGIYYKFRNICVVLPWYMNEEHALALLMRNTMY